jgi:hypothetical protein
MSRQSLYILEYEVLGLFCDDELMRGIIELPPLTESSLLHLQTERWAWRRSYKCLMNLKESLEHSLDESKQVVHSKNISLSSVLIHVAEAKLLSCSIPNRIKAWSKAPTPLKSLPVLAIFFYFCLQQVCDVLNPLLSLGLWFWVLSHPYLSHIHKAN